MKSYVADVATKTMSCSFVGAVFGAFTPYAVPFSKRAMENRAKFVPLPPLSSASSVAFYAAFSGSVAAVQRVTSGAATLARDRYSVSNDVFGVGAVYVYTHALLKSQQRVIWNQRLFYGAVVGSILYANTAESMREA